MGEPPAATTGEPPVPLGYTPSLGGVLESVSLGWESPSDPQNPQVRRLWLVVGCSKAGKMPARTTGRRPALRVQIEKAGPESCLHVYYLRAVNTPSCGKHGMHRGLVKLEHGPATPYNRENSDLRKI